VTDASFTDEQKEKKPVYFSVIQYFEVPKTDQQVSFGFRLAFVPGDNPEVLLGNELSSELSETAFESQPWYGSTFRFGVQKGLEEGRAECRGSSDSPEDVGSNGGLTTACPFAPDESGEVAGQTFLASLKLSSEVSGEPGGGGGGGAGGGGGVVGGGGGGDICATNNSCPASQAPAPLPIAGAGAAFAWSRRVRRRYTLAPANAQIVA
jgi:hypothetical protein